MYNTNSLSQARYIILDNVRSAYNVGAIFRTAEASGVDKIFLAGYTPRPVDRFGRTVKEIAKTSLGASDLVSWEGVLTASEVIYSLRQNGVQVVAVELASDAVSLYDFSPQAQVAYVFGNEVEGISSSIRGLCDLTLQIPMRGRKESLNVATTAGIILFHHPLT